MTSLVTSLNASLAASEAARLAQAQQLRAQEDVVANQLRAFSAAQGLPANATITASYKFNVGSDGSLTPTETKITTQPNPVDGNKSRRQSDKSNIAIQTNVAASSSFFNFLRPKPQLSPTDELTLFSGENSSEFNANESAASVQSQTLSIAAQAQRAAADLYARNSDVIYNVHPLIYEAA